MNLERATSGLSPRGLGYYDLVLVASGFAIAGLVAPQAILPLGAAPGEASFVFALYAAARSLPLAAFALWAIAQRNVQALIVLGALAGVVQLMDAGIGLVQHDPGKTIGPAGHRRAAGVRNPSAVKQGRQLARVRRADWRQSAEGKALIV